MFIPWKVSDFVGKIVSLYVANSSLNAGSLVDVDPSDTIAVGANASVGFTTMRAGGLVLASVTTSNAFPKELGMAIPTVNDTGPTLEERILELASSYMTIPQGYACAVFVPGAGDIVATDQYVGALPSDSAATGKLDTTSAGNFGCGMGIFQGRFRKVTGSDVTRARYLGNSTANGAAVALFQFA